MTSAKQVAQALLSVQAVTLNAAQPYCWASGLRSPIYCDNRITIAYPHVRRLIADQLAALIRQHYPQVEVIAGTATAGIPHAAFVAERLGLPMVYVRSKPKEHGQGRQIEGFVSSGQKVVMIEDLISTGGSVIEAAQAAEREGVNVIGCAAIFNYGLQKGQERFAQAGYPLVTLTDYDTLIDVALEQGTIDAADLALLRTWRQDPEKWSQAHGGV